MSWFWFALLASACWAAVQTVDKTLIKREAPTTNHYLFASGIAAVIPATLMPLLFSRVVTLPDGSVTLAAMTAGVCYFLSNFFFFRALKYVDASVSSAAVAVVPSFTAIGSWLILSETVSWLPVAGIVLISAGVFVLSYASSEAGRVGIPRQAWIALALADAILVVEYLIEARVVREIEPLNVFYWTRVGVVFTTVSAAIVRPRFAWEAVSWAYGRSRKVGLMTATNEGLDMVAISLLITAFQSGPAGVATAVAYTQTAFVVVGTYVINAIYPGAIPVEGNRPHAFRWRLLGLLSVLAGVFVANAFTD